MLNTMYPAVLTPDEHIDKECDQPCHLLYFFTISLSIICEGLSPFYSLIRAFIIFYSSSYQLKKIFYLLSGILCIIITLSLFIAFVVICFDTSISIQFKIIFGLFSILIIRCINQIIIYITVKRVGNKIHLLMDAVSGIDANNQWIAYNQAQWIQVIVLGNKVYKENVISTIENVEKEKEKENVNVKYQNQSHLPKDIWYIIVDYAMPFEDYSDETKYRQRLKEIDDENKRIIENLDETQFDQLYFQTIIGMPKKKVLYD